jgi:zinc and cadmium transporter
VPPSRSSSPSRSRSSASYLGFFAGVLLYLATSDILPEAHAHHPTRLTLACTIVGVGFMWLVIGLAS